MYPQVSILSFFLSSLIKPPDAKIHFMPDKEQIAEKRAVMFFSDGTKQKNITKEVNLQDGVEKCISDIIYVKVK